MTKADFLSHVQAIYRVANRADADTREPWTKPRMAGGAGCRSLDAMLNAMVECGAISPEDHQELYDTL